MSEYISLSLDLILKQAVKDTMKEKDWEIEAIDLIKNKIILKR